MRTKRIPELLAPAGDQDCLRAAVANGADAVYLGLPRFNARQRATNFAPDDLGRVVEFLHDHNVRAYVALNTLVFADELAEASGCIETIASAGADAVIVQDLGLARLIGRMAPTLAIHASTQMTLADARAIETAAALGVRRVILPRELSLADIAAIRHACNVELEVFVHGALCVSYSGQCLASEALFNRSGNRGQCAQACRLPYELLIDGEAAGPAGRRFPLSPRDLCAWDRVGELVKLGVAGLKIEGRLKDATYVAAAVRAYRAALDAAGAGSTRDSAAARNAMTQTFSRGWTRGFLDGPDHVGLVDGRFGGHRGQLLGVVTGRTPQGLLVELAGDDISVRPGDGLMFDEGRDEADEQGGRVYAVRPGRGRRITELQFARDAVQIARIATGTPVYRTDDPQLRRQLEATFSRVDVVRREPIAIHVEAAVGRAIRVTVTDPAGRSVTVQSEQPAERAVKHPLSVEQLREPFGRLGNTPFEPGSIELTPPADEPGADTAVMAPKSVLNDLRRRAVELLVEQRRAATRHAIADRDALAGLRPADGGAAAVASPGLTVLVRTEEQLSAVLAWGDSHPGRLGAVYCDLPDISDSAAILAQRGRRDDQRAERPEEQRAGRPEEQRAGPSSAPALGLATPRIIQPGEDDLLAAIVDAKPGIVLVRNLSALQFLRKKLPIAELVGDQCLNAANDLSARWLWSAGLARVAPAVELSADQFRAMATVSPAGWEPVVYQHITMFHTRHCVLAASRGGRDPATCGQPCRAEQSVRLRDRVGMDLPVMFDSACRNSVFFGRPRTWQRQIAPLRALGVARFRVELAVESGAEACAALETLAAGW